MNGKTVVTAFLFIVGAFILFAVLFGLYPPAGNSPLTLAGVVAYVAIAVWVTRRVTRQ